MNTKPLAEERSPVARGPDGRVVRDMFAQIAHRYDFLNHFLSASIDRRWRKLAAAKVGEHLHLSTSALCLDLCSGTGDLAIELQTRLGVHVVASDFCHPMLVRSLAKTRAIGAEQKIRTIEADSLETPFRSSSFDAVTIAFGLRNLEDVRRGLIEMSRLLKPGGVLVVLEFSRPVIPVFREGFEFYFHRVLPRIGAWISGQKTAYRYLPDSVRRFPTQRVLASMIEDAGFLGVSYRNLSGGIAALHWGVRRST
jgi:demethylmenaquinone methyltransferase/2-methoxy-6-polyprenyl-1,4-benzoquinol methylase